MKIIYLTLLLTSIISPVLMAQNHTVLSVDWSIVASIPPATNESKSIGLAGAMSGIHDQALIVAGGTNFPDAMPWLGGAKVYYDIAFVYPQVNSQSPLKLSACSYKLPFKLAYAASCSTGRGLVVAGGENEFGLSKKVLLLTWVKQADILRIEYLPDLPFGITNASLAAVGEVVYLSGGEVPSGSRSDFLCLNLKDPSLGWQALPSLPKALSHAVLLGSENTGEIYLIGGRGKQFGELSKFSDSFFSFDIKKNTWKQMPDLPFALSAASGIINGHDLLIFSGDAGETFYQAEKLIVAMQNEKDVQKKERLNRKKIMVQASHPGFSRKVLKYNLLTGKWQILKHEMTYGPVTVNASGVDEEVFIAGGEIKAGVRTPNVLRGKLKFDK